MTVSKQSKSLTIKNHLNPRTTNKAHLKLARDSLQTLAPHFAIAVTRPGHTTHIILCSVVTWWWRRLSDGDDRTANDPIRFHFHFHALTSEHWLTDTTCVNFHSLHIPPYTGHWCYTHKRQAPLTWFPQLVLGFNEKWKQCLWLFVHIFGL